MTLDEAIRSEEMIVDACESTASTCDLSDRYERNVAYENSKCAKKHKQIAEWLKQLQTIQNIIDDYRNTPVEIMDGYDAFIAICEVVDE